MRLLFVCTGNTCRSPLAEVIARRYLTDRGASGVSVGSAGTGAWPDAPASDGSLLVALEHGLDLASHRARSLTADLVREADLVLTMGASHRERVDALGGTGRSWLLTEYAGAGNGGISDPFGGDLTVYRATYEELDRVVRGAIDRILRDQPI